MKKLYTSVFCMLLCSCILTACNDKTPLSKLQKGSSSSDSSFRKLISSSLVSHRLSGFFSDSRRDHCTRLFTDAVEEAIAQNASISNPSIPSSNYTNGQQVALDPSWEYADHSAISSGTATIYLATSNRKGKIIGVNAGHGTSGGTAVKTLCHPDGSPKTTGGSTAEGAIQAIAVSSGMTFADGTPEPTVTLRMAQILKEKLLAEWYDVLMVRDGEDVQLDNVARTVLCNHVADCHIALHWDGDGLNYDKGCFYISVPDTLKSMEPVASHWQQHDALGEALISGLHANGASIYQNGHMSVDLTQTSYSTIPSVDVELGNAASDHSDSTLSQLADGLVQGLNQYSW